MKLKNDSALNIAELSAIAARHCTEPEGTGEIGEVAKVDGVRLASTLARAIFWASY
ncbi:hypothetical protein [Altericista sp. CCNU0014]|uniref:hypothetical protein n=1 Tax=Altericista sp. CCNU0014 TaxID=3082949 RepID=UPI00384BBB4C